MSHIERIILHNFKRFNYLELPLDKTRNIIIGDNESGKSSILLAISLVLSGSRSFFEQHGAERLMHAGAIAKFNRKPARTIADLPRMYVELWLSPQSNFELNGKNNSKGVTADGLVMECAPNEEFSKEISQIISSHSTFPFDFYQVRYSTFQGDQYSGYKKYLRYLNIDTSSSSSEYAMREYVKSVYESSADTVEQHQLQHEYRSAKEQFRDNVLKPINERLPNYTFAIKHDQKANLSSDITIVEENISIDNRGLGRQCFVKADFALTRAKTSKARKTDVILLEEPENHLSHLLMHKLVNRISDNDDRQIFVATHSNMLTARLDLRKAIFLHSDSTTFARLDSVTAETANFFIKAPDHGLLDFVLSRRVILVEGDAEYILLEALYKSIAGKAPSDTGVHILSVGGTSFKRYLEIAQLLKKKVAVVRDNDGDYEQNCKKRYADYVDENIQVFADQDNEFSTFELCLYRDNKVICDATFKEGRRRLTVQQYMLDNKTDCALALLGSSEQLSVPGYIKEAIAWIRK